MVMIFGGDETSLEEAMDDRVFDPRDDIVFFMQQAEQFQGFARSIEQGDYSFDPLAALDEVRDRLERFKPLEEIRRIANLCADLPPLEFRVQKGEKVELEIRKEELVAHWQLAYFRGEIDEMALQKDAKRITKDDLDRLSKKFLQAQEKKAEAESHAGEVPDWHPDRQKALKAYSRALDAFQKARAELLDLVGAKGQRFDPEESYLEQWRDDCLLHYASLGIHEEPTPPPEWLSAILDSQPDVGISTGDTEDELLVEWLTTGSDDVETDSPRHPGLVRRLSGEGSRSANDLEDRVFARFMKLPVVPRALFSTIAEQRGTDYAAECFTDCRLVGYLFWESHAQDEGARKRLLIYAEEGHETTVTGDSRYPELLASLANPHHIEDPGVIGLCRALHVLNELWGVIGDDRMQQMIGEN